MLKNDKKNIKDSEFDAFLDSDETKEKDCRGDKACLIKQNKGIVERINKRIMTEDGRQLLM